MHHRKEGLRARDKFSGSQIECCQARCGCRGYRVPSFVLRGLDNEIDDDVLFTGTRFSNLYTAVDTPAWAACVPRGKFCSVMGTSLAWKWLFASGGDGVWETRTVSGPLLMRGDIFAASRCGGAGC